MYIDFPIYCFALLIGILLGLMGGGGSILTVPILVYVAGFQSIIATTYSFFIVGITSIIGMITYAKRGLVSFQSALSFALPSFIGAFLTRKFVFPLIPDPFLSYDGFQLSKGKVLMLIFAILILVAAISMIIAKKENGEKEEIDTKPPFFTWLIGFFTGFLTSLIGAGGGFIIIPTLVFLLRLPMKMAVGTSLFIIAVNSLLSFSGDLLNKTAIDWQFLVYFTFIATIGIILGSYFSQKVSGSRIRIVFGYFLVCIAFFILVKELILR
jgi:uncharacterized membrane protein YfcA